MREEGELKIALARSREKLAGLIRGFQAPPTRQRKRVAPLIKNGADVLRQLMEYQDWWNHHDLPSALYGRIPGGKVCASRDMFENFLKYSGISNMQTRRVLFESLEAAKLERELTLQDDLFVARGLKKEKAIIARAKDEYERHLAGERSFFYLAEFNLIFPEAHPSWPAVTVSITSGVERANMKATKSLYYRLSPKGSAIPPSFKPRWAGRGTVNVFTNSSRYTGEGLPARNRLIVLDSANKILMRMAHDLGKTSCLPFTVGSQD